jgi:hypothetical protein
MSPSSSLSRRDWLRFTAAGVVSASLSGWLEDLAAVAATDKRRRRSCILLWMNGGPSQLDTFDLKPGHAHGGPFKEIATATPGIKISEHLPKVSGQMKHLAVVRSMSTREGDHGRATFVMRTGYLPQGPVQYPPLGALVSKELAEEETALPPFVSIAPQVRPSPAAYGPGFLGPRYAPLVVGAETSSDRSGPGGDERSLKVQDLAVAEGVSREQAAARVRLLRRLQEEFVPAHPDAVPRGHQASIERAVRLMRPSAAQAFDLGQEKPALRDAYGRNLFGQGCLLARRLVERGVPFVEVTLGGLDDGVSGWDTHAQNFEVVRKLSAVLDPAWATLLEDLKGRGLLDSTLVVWMGEFGRTPHINQLNGRDHYPAAWSAVLGGGGIKGGQTVGKTSADGATVEDRPVSASDFLATVCLALGIDPLKNNDSNVGRPIHIVDKDARPLREVLS